MIQVKVKHRLMKEFMVFGPYDRLEFDYGILVGIKDDTQETVMDTGLGYGGACDTCAYEFVEYCFPKLPTNMSQDQTSMYDLIIEEV